MAVSEERAGRLREGLLALGFVLLLAAAALTVALPELTKEPQPGAEAGPKSAPQAAAAR